MDVLHAAWAVVGAVLCGAAWFCVLRRTRQVSASVGIVVLAAALLAVVVGVGARLAPSAQAAPAPSGQGFTVTPGDLKFILKQIKIAEHHAATLTASNPCGTLVGSGPDQIPDRLTSYGLRTVDGSCNNLFPGRETFAAADQPFPRLTKPTFKDAEPTPPGFGPPGPSSYAQKKGNVFDSQPRVISNLIVDQTSTNPAAIRAAGFPVRTQGNPGLVPCTTDPDPTANPPVVGVPADCVPSHHTLFIPNVTTDVGLSPPYNSLFTFFGQFFDHGVDQTVKSGGTVFVPLHDDDPLVTLGPDGKPNTGDEVPASQRFMVLTRAQNQPGPDGVLGDDPATPQDESADDVQDANNTDSPWVDQSQTYTSHSSHQALLREYVASPAGRDGIAGNADDNGPVDTGKLLGGLPGNGASGMATWASVKAQAASRLGLRLVDRDVTNVPMLAADPYGNFIPGPHGLPQYVTKTHGLVEGNLASPVPVPADVRYFDTPFLTDIAHNADPSPQDTDHNPATPPVAPTPDADNVASADFANQPPGTYDDEMLDAHFCAGDGRVNENIALTTIHQVFHSEHDRLVDYIKDVLTNDTSPEGVAALAEWKLANGGAGGWNGSRLFQAARFVTEMEYQHLVFEEFGRKIQPAIRPFHVYHPDINAAIPAEFAHAVYRFGHSMLDDDVARTNVDPVTGAKSDNSIPLLTAFLNPPEYFNGHAAGTLTPEQAAGSVVMGSSDQTGNELDEFVTETLRNNLLGLPLDLPTLNLARARDAGVPSLNEVRRQAFAATNDGAMTPYTSWSDYGQHLKHPESLINFVAAYGLHPTITGATTLAAKREAAKNIVDPAAPADAPADASDFMFSAGTWANRATGYDDVDLWVGGLAELTNLGGGLLGSTFNYVFQSTMENLQDGDRFYYLFRTPGLNLRTQLEGNSFAELIQRNTEGTNSLKADAFATADCKFQLANLAGTAAGFGTFGSTVANDPSTACDESALLLRKPDGTIQYRQFNSVDPSGINGQSVYNGSPGADRIFGGNDNDTFWGGGGNDVIEGNNGDDVALGGEGNDIITDLNGADVLKGGPGNDAIDGGPGDDIVLSGDGSDFTNGGANDNETFGGPGNDFINAGQGADAVFGDGGDDWIQGGSGQDLLQGDHGAPFFDDPGQIKPGNDVFIGQVGENDYDTEGGDDLMSQNAAVDRNAGSGGFDWAFHQYDTVAANDDMAINNFLPGNPLPVVVNRDRWQETEGDSGSPFDDVIKGDKFVPSAQGGAGFTGCDALDQAGVDRIGGLAALLPPLAGNAQTDVASGGPICPLSGPFWGAGNILLGGAGNDTIEGRGGDDIIDGDKALTVRISVRTDPNNPATEIGSTDLMEHQYLRDTAGNPTGPTLQAAVFAGTVDPGNLVVVREIVNPGLLPIPFVDTAVFSGPRANYTITPNLNTTKMVVTDNVGLDGVDTLYGIEKLQFTDGIVSIIPSGSLSAASLTFAAQTTNTTSAAQTVTLTNGGQQPLVLTGLAIAGTNATEFVRPAGAAGGTCAATTTLNNGQACTVSVTFRPTAAGSRTAILRFTDNNNAAPGSLQDVALSGTGVLPAPVAGVNPASLTFAARNNGTTSAAQTVTLLNTGNAPLALASIALTGDYARSGGTCPAAGSGSVAAGTSCTVGATFTPTAAGARPGTLVFTDNSGNTAGSTQTVTLSGTGVAPTPVAGIAPATLTFATRATATTSVAQTVTLSNTGNKVLTIASIGFVGTNPGDYARSGGSCGATLNAGATCTIAVTFTPTAVAARTATLRVTDDSGNTVGSTQNVTLTGTGRAPAPGIAATPSPVAFGNNSLLLGGAGVTRAITVTSNGELPVAIGAVTITGTNPGNFTFTGTNTCANTTRAVNATCTITVRFRASTPLGAKTATLNIASNALGAPTTIPLTGNAGL
jgi:Ca2+-binding RTX toxin-like protein